MMKDRATKTVLLVEDDADVRDSLQDILEDEEEHLNWLEAQQTLIEQAGLQNYLAEQIKKDES